MAKLELSRDLSLSPEDAWEHVSDLSTLGDWLSMHEGWRSDLPSELEVGTTIVGVAGAKGMRNRVTWTIVELDAPHHVVLKGTGKGGTKFSMRLAVAARGDGSTLSMKIDLGGAPLFGPIGSGVARALHGDLQSSLDTFSRRYGGN